MGNNDFFHKLRCLSEWMIMISKEDDLFINFKFEEYVYHGSYR